MKYRLLILDFDGTIADTRKTIVRTFQMTMKKLCLPVQPEEVCASTIGLTLEGGFAAMFPMLSEEQVNGCAAAYRRIFEENRKTLSPPVFPGVKETLRTLAERGHILTIASSRHAAGVIAFLEDFGIRDIFEYVLGAGDVEKAKPDPAPVLKTLEALDILPENALVIGDMPFDIMMGKGAGTSACGVTYGNSSRRELCESGADFVIDSFDELLAIA